MGQNQVHGRSLNAIAKDVAEGFVVVNPQLLKQFDAANIKDLHLALKKTQKDLRGQAFPTSDIQAIRKRNIRLQRLHQAVTVVEFTSREKRIALV